MGVFYLKNKKRFVALCLSMLMSTSFAFAKPQYNYIEKKEAKTIAQGVDYEEILQFTSDGVRGINLIKFNLNDSTVSLVPIYNYDTTSRGMAVSKMVDGHGVTAGINGDFFNYNPAFPLGPAIKNGQVIYSNGDGPSLTIDNNNQASIQKLNIAMSVSVGGKTIPVGIVNKPNNYGSTGMYTRAWGKKSRGGKVNSQTEIAVLNGKVIARADQGDPLEIPDNGYVLNIKDGLYLPNVGDDIAFNITGVDINNIKFGIGAGAVILRDGAIVNEGIDAPGRHPRTAIGFNKQTGDIFLVTVDGRSQYHGMEMSELAELLISFGATDGVNLDGGGSTTMAIKDVNSGKAKVVNHISSERSVLNGVGVKSTSTVGQPVKIKVITEGKKLFKNTTKWINIEAYDINGNPVKADLSQVKLTANLPIKVNKHSFMPTESGMMDLTVTYGNLSETVSMEVLDSPSVLLLDTDTLGLAAGGSYRIPNVYGIDAVGNRALIRAHELKTSVVGGVGTINNNVFKRNNAKTNGAIVLAFGNAKNRIVVTSSARKESVNPLGSADGLTTFASPKGSTSAIKIVEDKRKALRLDYNFAKVKGTKVATLAFANPPTMPKDTTELSIFTKNHGEDAVLSTKVVVDGVESEQVFEENLKLGGYTEWRAKLPGGTDIKLKSISISNPGDINSAKGNFFIKDIAAVINPDTSAMFTDQRTLFNDHLRSADLASTDIAVVVAGKGADAEKIKNATANHKKVALINSNLNSANIAKDMVVADGNTLFVNFKNTKGGLRASDINQWNQLLTRVKNGTESNILISIAGGSKDELGIINPIERQLLKETFESLVDAGKRVFVITNLKEPTSTRFDEGVRYINLNPGDKEALYLNINRIGDNVIYAVKKV